MALIQFEFRSETLGLASQVNVVFSQSIKKLRGPDYRSPVLYLLHGLSDDHSAWIRKTSIERFAEAYDLVVVMPAVHRSFYRNTHAGHRYYDYVNDELPELCKSYFPIASEPNKTFVAGNSMGGYGAFKLALSNPAKFAAAASLSGALDIALLTGQRDEMLPEWAGVFGPQTQIEGSDDDLIALLTRAKKFGKTLPDLYQCCGTEDYLYPVNQSFLAAAQNAQIPVTYEESPAEHNWGYWDTKIQTVLEWLPIEKLEKPARKKD